METGDYQMTAEEVELNQRRLFWAYAASVLLIVNIVFAIIVIFGLEGIQQAISAFGGSIFERIAIFLGISTLLGIFTPEIGRAIMLVQVLGLVATGFSIYQFWHYSELKLKARHAHLEREFAKQKKQLEAEIVAEKERLKKLEFFIYKTLIQLAAPERSARIR